MKSNRIWSRIGSLMVALAMIFLASCTAIQVQNEMVLNEDGSGNRMIRGLVAKEDHQDGFGSAYYYLKQHGEELQTYLVNHYQTKVPGSEEWLNVAVDDTDATWETIELSFDFSTFDEYVERLKALAYGEEQAATFVDPTLETTEDGVVTFTESAANIKAIFKSLQLDMMADPDMFDEQSTKDGTALNDGSADLPSLTDFGVELIKPENGDAFTITIGQSEPAVLAADSESFIHTARYDGGSVESGPAEPEKVLEFTFEDSLANTGSLAENDLTVGVGSTSEEAVYVEGVDGQGIQFDGATYLASPNETYKYDELTLSFYFKMDEYTETDTGANMVLVPAGLGALGAGVIDLEFLQTEDNPGISFLAKMNSNDWMTQDNLFVGDYYLENHPEEWHHYTVVYDNEYDEFGNVLEAFVYIYIDGQMAARQALTVAAGLPYSLGLFDDGAAGDPNGGYNIGGYYEAETVKRGITGTLDNLVIYSGALAEEEVNELLYTVEVDNPYDPSVMETPGGSTEETTVATTEEATEAPTTVAPTTVAPTTTAAEEPVEQANNTGLIVGIIAAVVVIGGAALYLARRKKS